MAADHTFPSDEVLASLAERAAGGDDAPVVMLNLNTYKPLAEYADGRATDGMTGREAYLQYGLVAYGAIAQVGGAILWAADCGTPVIGCDHDAYDEVVAVWYPSIAAFLALEDVPGYRDALAHREAAIERASLIPCPGEAEPVLRNPWG